MKPLALASVATLCLVSALRAQPLPPPPVPAGNPITTAKINLGKALFFDEQLSSTGTVACATCHIFSRGSSDPRSPTSLAPGADGLFGTADDVHGSPGVIAQASDGNYVDAAPFSLRPQVTGRKAQPAIMAAYNTLQFWDGRASDVFRGPTSGSILLGGGASLESQAAEPPINEVEMAHAGADWTGIVARLRTVRPLALATNVPAALDTWIAGRSYTQLFQEAFGQDITAGNACMAIATYERTLVPNQAPIDAFLAGNQNALTPQQQRGLQIFNGPGRCNQCHGGPAFMGPPPSRFFNIGVRPPNEDRGRGAITGNPQDEGAFKVPSLRNVGLRAPYFHDGSKTSLRQVVDFYARGGDFRQNQTNLIRRLNLNNGQRNDLVAFLQFALTDPRVTAEQAPFDRPTLYSESNRMPLTYGFGTVGSGNIAPRLVAVEPPVLDNPSFTFALGSGLGGAPAAILIDDQQGFGQSILGAAIYVAATPRMLALPLGTLNGGGPGAGWASRSFPLPATLGETTMFLQGIVIDQGASQSVSATAGLRVSLFAPR